MGMKQKTFYFASYSKFLTELLRNGLVIGGVELHFKGRFVILPRLFNLLYNSNAVAIMIYLCPALLFCLECCVVAVYKAVIITTQ